MMKVRLPSLVQDPEIGRYKDLKRTEGMDLQGAFFLDGPVTDRVAVIDFDQRTGAVMPGAKLRPLRRGRVLRSYDVDLDDWTSPAFMQVSVFSTVMAAVRLLESPAVLGRRLRWGFDGPQLLVVPRAGEWANAFYERASRSLQFYSFTHEGQEIHTCLSSDIVTHETAHAVLDGIAPHLYHAVSPQSLAIHEAVADLTALTMAFASRNLRETVLAQTGGSIAGETAFTNIAEQFGRALRQGGRMAALRSVNNERSLDPETGSAAWRLRPHELSEVLSGACFKVMAALHERLTDRYEHSGLPHLAAAGKALGVGHRQFARVIFRALDYLPPGEASFADFGRCVIAADQVAYPRNGSDRAVLTQEFAARHIVPDVDALAVPPPRPEPAFDGVDRQLLADRDYVAYDFVQRNRALFGVPPDVPFDLAPRLVVTKDVRQGTQQQARELIIKVSWEQDEPNRIGGRFPARRAITRGTTVAVDWDTPALLARLTSDPGEDQREDRDGFLRSLRETESLVPFLSIGPDQLERQPVIGATVTDGHMRVLGSARLLHLMGGGA